MDSPVDEDLTSLSNLDQETDLLRKANVNSLMKIAQLQAQIAQLRTKLAIKGKEIEGARRKAKGELKIGRRLGAGHMALTAVEDIITFLTLLEEENRDLRELSTIPVEIEKLKTEVTQMNQRKQSCDLRFRDYLSPENTSGTQALMGHISGDVAQLRAEIADFKQRLTEETVARAHLQNFIVPSLERSKASLEKELSHLRTELLTVKEKEEESLVSFQSQHHFKRDESVPVIPLSPTAGHKPPFRGSMSVRVQSATGAMKSKRSGEVSVYSPTFLRTPKARKLPKAKTQTLFLASEESHPIEDRGQTATPELTSKANHLSSK